MIERVRAWPDLYFVPWRYLHGFAGRGVQPVRLLESLAGNAESVGALRGLLVRGTHDPGIPQLAENDVIAQTARRIRSGDLLVLRERIPWRNAIPGLGAWPGLSLLWRHPAGDFRDRGRALTFLSPFHCDVLALAAFRRLLARDFMNRGVDRAGDRQVIQEVARLLVSGDLLVGWDPPPWGAVVVGEDERRESVVVPRVRRSWPVHAAHPPEPSTYGAGHDGAAQAEALAGAADSGAAWCEICQKEAAAAARS